MWKPVKWMPVVVWPKFMAWWSKLNGFKVAGVTLPLLIVLNQFNLKYKYQRDWHDRLVNHESIHIVQQVELLVIGFYLLYGINYLINLARYRNHYKAYRHIIFEREAFKNEWNLDYLKTRKPYAWLRLEEKEDEDSE